MKTKSKKEKKGKGVPVSGRQARLDPETERAIRRAAEAARRLEREYLHGANTPGLGINF